MKNNLLRGVRLASDFLMGLQATGAYKANSLANLQLRLPAVVIGGGLTAIDTATEMQAYYVVQAEKTLDRYDRLVRKDRRGGDLGEAGRGRTRDHRDLVEAWPGDSRRALRGGRRRSRARLQSPGPGLGRRHHRLSQTLAGFAGVSPQPRRSHQVARGRHSLRRTPQPGRVHPRRSRRRGRDCAANIRCRRTAAGNRRASS